MDDTLQQALFGGNISGRRLRGVKINPIYQENDPGGRDGQPGDTQSESALPIGEIQIDMYESLPRSSQRSFRQSNSDPTLPSPKRQHASAAGSGKGQGRSSQAASSSAGGAGEGKERRKGEGDDGKTSPAVPNAMGVDNLPWTFLQQRSPAKREAVWGAFRSLEDHTLPGVHEDREECLEVLVNHNPTSSSSENRTNIPSIEELSIITKDDEAVGVHVLESSGEGESLADLYASPGHSVKRNDVNCGPYKDSPPEYQTYFVTTDNTPAPFLPHSGFPYDVLDSYTKSQNGKNGYSDFVHFAEHNHHHYSVFYGNDVWGIDGKGSNSTSRCQGNELSDLKYPSLGANGLRVNGVISPEDGQVLCTCSCHAQVPSDDVTRGVAGPTPVDDAGLVEDVQNDKNVHTGEDQQMMIATESASDATDANSPSMLKDEYSNPNEGAKSNSSLASSQGKELQAPYHEHSEACLLDFENNNNCIMLNKLDKEDLSSEHSDSLETDTKLFLDTDQKEKTEKEKNRSKDKETVIRVHNKPANTNQTVENCSKNDSFSNKICKEESRNEKPGLIEGNAIVAVCKLCGCPQSFGNGQSRQLNIPTRTTPTCLADDMQPLKEITPQYLHTPKDVSALLSSDSFLLRVEELNAPAYLQRYLVEAQKNYLQKQQSPQILNDDIITDVSSTIIPPDDASPVLPDHQISHLIVPDTGELREDLSYNGDSTSDIGELGCYGLKNSCAAKSFKTSGSGSISSRGNSRQSSRNNSRQSSRNSRVGKHSSIEDMEAEDDEAMVGSQWGGSSNRSNSFIDRNDNLKKNGLSIIHVGGTTTDPSFEMIVPYDEAFEEESNYSSRRRQRLEEMAEQQAWKEDGTAVRDRVIKAVVCTLLFCLFVGIFVGVAIHFGKESRDEGETGNEEVISSGSGFGVYR